MKQLFLASTFFQVVSLAAAIDAGTTDATHYPPSVLDPDGLPRRAVTERILLVSDHAQVLELSSPLADNPALAPALTRFDRVVSLNDTLHPHHPTAWKPSEQDLVLLESALRDRWGLGEGPVELVLESPQVNPAIALARVFGSAFIRVHSDGLMSYGPTRSAIPLAGAQRMTALHHLPLVEGLTPRLLSEYGITPVTTPAAAFTAVIEEIAALGPGGADPQLADLDPATTALGFGQYLAALGLLTDEQEATLHADMVRAAAARGMTAFAFKPHPAAPEASRTEVEAAAAAAGIELRVLDTPAIAEVLIARFRPALVVGSFSTALATARAFYDRPIVAVGTELLLESITPYQNSNRVPASLMHELSGADAHLGSTTQQELRTLIDTVCYTMQPELLSHLRPQAEAFLSSPAGPAKRAHFKRLRLTRLDLPGGIPPSRTPRATARRVVRAAVSAVRPGRARLRTR
jgi:hypothetical protein